MKTHLDWNIFVRRCSRNTVVAIAYASGVGFTLGPQNFFRSFFSYLAVSILLAFLSSHVTDTNDRIGTSR